MQFPHSRWNEVRADALTSCGYEILTQSAEAGVDLFVKKKRSLFVHFQGHPEYGARTLLKEYRRDIKRFLRQRKRNVSHHAAWILRRRGSSSFCPIFERMCKSDPREEHMAGFPGSRHRRCGCRIPGSIRGDRSIAIGCSICRRERPNVRVRSPSVNRQPAYDRLSSGKRSRQLRLQIFASADRR